MQAIVRIKIKKLSSVAIEIYMQWLRAHSGMMIKVMWWDSCPLRCGSNDCTHLSGAYYDAYQQYLFYFSLQPIL